MELLPLKPISSNLTFRRSLLTDMTWSQSFLRKNLTMTLSLFVRRWHASILRERSHNQFYWRLRALLIPSSRWKITRNAWNFQTFSSWILGIRPALSFHINYPLVKESVDLIHYINFGFKLNKVFIELTNFL